MTNKKIGRASDGSLPLIYRMYVFICIC